jgi:hypothetical protein
MWALRVDEAAGALSCAVATRQHTQHDRARKPLTRDEARRIAANIAKLPEPATQGLIEVFA